MVAENIETSNIEHRTKFLFPAGIIPQMRQHRAIRQRVGLIWVHLQYQRQLLVRVVVCFRIDHLVREQQQ